MFPALKKSIEIKIDNNRVVFIDHKDNSYYILFPLEAYLICQFDGTRDIDTVAKNLSLAQSAPSIEEIKDDLLKILNEREILLENIPELCSTPIVKTNASRFLSLNKNKSSTRLSNPLSLELMVTKNCNLKCEYCFANAEYTSTRKNSANELSLKEIKSIIKEAAQIGICNILISGGEPLVREEIIEILNECKKLKLSTSLVTNGYFMTDELAKEIYKSGITELQLKLDSGLADVQDSITKVKGSFNNFISSIKILKENNFNITCVSVVTSKNIDTVPLAVEKCIELGVNEISTRIYAPGIWKKGIRGSIELIPKKKDIQKLTNILIKQRKSYSGKIKITLPDYSPYSICSKENVPRCGALESTMTILPDGSVTPCEMIDNYSDEFVIGNTKSNSILEIWNSNAAQNWFERKSPSLSLTCKSCDEFSRCKGGCPWKAIVAFGTWYCDPCCIESPINEITSSLNLTNLSHYA